MRTSACMAYPPTRGLLIYPAPRLNFATRWQPNTPYPGWTFNYGGTLSGTLTINTYDASATVDKGGAILDATYTRAASDPILDDLQFIQKVSTSAPLPGAPNPKIDYIPEPGGGDDGLPFYDSLAGSAPYKDATAGTYNFYDAPSRGYGTSLSWTAELLLASWSGGPTNKTVTVYDGVSWGWYMQQYAPPAGRFASDDVASASTDGDRNLTAVPEPSSLAIAFVGLAAVGLYMMKGRS